MGLKGEPNCRREEVNVHKVSGKGLEDMPSKDESNL